MRHNIVSFVSLAIAIVALGFCYSQRNDFNARASAYENALEFSRNQQQQLLLRTKELVDSNGQVTALLARIALTQEEKDKAVSDLAKGLTELDKRTLMSVETINLARKNTQDLKLMREQVLETFERVGQTFHDIEERFKLQIAANREELKNELEAKK